MEIPPSISSVVGDKRLWDVTARFRHVAANLPVGSLVKDENFTLFESVGALEIMDPKMDSGCLQPGEALVDEYDLDRVLSPEEVIGIMDQFLCVEMAWHEGYPLAQTLFSSHYIDKVLSLEARTIDQIHFTTAGQQNIWSAPLLHLVLRSYSIAVVKCCDYALEEINRSLDGGGTRTNFYEEEDFSCHTYNRELFTRIAFEPIFSLLTKATEFVESEKSYSLQGKRQTPPEVYEALSARLHLRLSTLQAMSNETDYDDKHIFWHKIPELLKPVQQSHQLGLHVAESFSPKIQRRLASTVPPKPMVEMSFTNAMSTMEQICKDCQEALRIIRFGPDNIQALKAFLWSFSSRQPEPWTYPRACLATPLFTCDDAGFEQLLRKDLEDIVFPASEVLDAANWAVETPLGDAAATNRQFQMVKQINSFTNMAVRMPGGYVDFFRALTSNRCRVRRNLMHIAMAFEELQTRETEQLDSELHKYSKDGLQYPLSTWTYLQKLRVMEWTISLGFELDVYLQDELAGMYWYLSLLAASRNSLLEVITSATETRLAKLQGQEAAETGKINELKRSLALLQSLRAEAQGSASLATALSSIYIFLSYVGVLPSAAVNSTFYRPHLKYELRMKPFLNIKSPELPTFEDWTQTLHPFGQYDDASPAFAGRRKEFLQRVDQQIKAAKANFGSVKKLGAVAAGCEGVEDAWTKNISALLQSCIAAGIAYSMLTTVLPGTESAVSISALGKSRYHSWWIIPKITQSQGA